MTLKAVDSWFVTVKHLKPKKIRRVTARRIKMIVKNNSKGGFTVNGVKRPLV